MSYEGKCDQAGGTDAIETKTPLCTQGNNAKAFSYYYNCFRYEMETSETRSYPGRPEDGLLESSKHGVHVNFRSAIIFLAKKLLCG